MAGEITVVTKGFQEVDVFFKETEKRMRNVEPALKQGAVLMLSSIERNFQESGRPRRWRRLASSTLKYKIRKGWSPLPLIRTGLLKNSMAVRTDSAKLVIGTAVPYAPFHQFGTQHIPKRQFLLFQNEDIKNINRLVKEHITNAGR